MTALRRPPAVAGMFYPEDPAELAREVERCFTDPRGPGALPERHRRADRRVLAADVPHAGYRYSGPIAAWAYAEIAADRPPESVLVLGVDHHAAGHGPALSERPWETPLGPTEIDAELVRSLAHPPVAVDETAHAREHSIEVQLPFLEYVLPRPRVVPLQVPFGPLARLREVGGIVREAIEGRDVLLLASTDLSHYVPVRSAERLDRLAIEAVLAGEPAGLYETVVGHDISMCGIAPTTVLLEALRGTPAVRTLRRWGHSGEVEPMREVVGYASIVCTDARSAPPPVK